MKSCLAALKNNSREGGAPCGLGEGGIHSFMKLWDSGGVRGRVPALRHHKHILITHLTHTQVNNPLSSRGRSVEVSLSAWWHRGSKADWLLGEEASVRTTSKQLPKG